MSDRLFCFYGDDFTGSTDALEALAANGIESVLFLDPPGESQLAAFAHCRAIGVAGESRSRSPEWMSEHLPSVFRSLKGLGAPICQYKVCSTFDSSPKHGNIGRVLEIGQREFPGQYIPIVVAAPHLRRYVIFGNLFAAGPGGRVYRIDRHPSMSRHPVTPMREADLTCHLGSQTGLLIGRVELPAIHGSDPQAALDHVLAEGRPAAVLFDGFDDKSLSVVGRLVSNQAFAVGSAGLTHALIHYWRERGDIQPDFQTQPAKAAERLIVISGSCSPITEAQIRWAMSHGFAHFQIDPEHRTLDIEQHALAALSAGQSLVLYTALGPAECGRGFGGEELGRYLGEMLRRLLLNSGARRVLIAGGDTSSHSVRQLGVHALTFAAVTTPGAPLCRCHSQTPALDGLEIVLKGGQVGPENYFEIVKTGKS